MTDRATVLAFMRSQRYAVEATVGESGHVQAAVVGIAITDDFEIVFDTLDSSRKVANLRDNPHVALVIGGRDGEECTVQYEGIAVVSHDADRDRCMTTYCAVFPDGADRAKWPGLVYVRVRPTWLRYSDYNQDPPVILELDASALTADSPT
jgi:general stress protein 26